MQYAKNTRMPFYFWSDFAVYKSACFSDYSFWVGWRAEQSQPSELCKRSPEVIYFEDLKFPLLCRFTSPNSGQNMENNRKPVAAKTLTFKQNENVEEHSYATSMDVASSNK